MSNNTHVLNVSYQQPLTPEVLNKIPHALFTDGVIEGAFTFAPKSVTISSVSFLIHPQNKTDILVRIDTTEPIIVENTSSANLYLVARYRWENANVGADFLFVDSITSVESDVILVGLVLDETGNIVGLDYDVQERAKLKTIQEDTDFPLILKLDGYKVGHGSGYIPISDGDLNETLNAQYFKDKDITLYAVSKEAETITINEETSEEIITLPTYPDWMDTAAVDRGEGITAEYALSYGIQPQDGTTAPDRLDRIPIANTILQKSLTAQFLNGYEHNIFAKTTHLHTLDDILDDGNISAPWYYRVVGVIGGAVTASSIEEDDIDYRQVEMLAYDTKTYVRYQPIYESGMLELTGFTPATITFARAINNARVILQLAPTTTPTVGAEKRAASVYDITTASFKAKQMGSIIQSGGTNYVRSNAQNAVTNQYYYFVVGEAI